MRVQRLQGVLPLNPRGFDGVAPDLAFNTSISFITNTNWQNYAGETTMSHLTQMLGLTAHNFVSAATGLAMAFALVRGFARSSAATLGNFWVDLTRVTLYLLLPFSIVVALVSSRSACPRRWPARSTRRRSKARSRPSRSGPMASQEAIKQLGTNGGGFFNANSAHPFENPNALDQHARDLGAAPDPGRVGAGLRPHRRRHAAGLGDPRRHGVFLLAGVARRLLGREPPAIRS